ncbi:MAG: hypothetical protein ACREQF_04890 [Candidatus Binataceae bacterium]
MRSFRLPILCASLAAMLAACAQLAKTQSGRAPLAAPRITPR